MHAVIVRAKFQGLQALRLQTAAAPRLTRDGGRTRHAIKFIDWMLFAKYIAALLINEDAFDAAPDAVTLRSMFATSLLPATPHRQKF